MYSINCLRSLILRETSGEKLIGLSKEHCDWYHN